MCEDGPTSKPRQEKSTSPHNGTNHPLVSQIPTLPKMSPLVVARLSRHIGGAASLHSRNTKAWGARSHLIQLNVTHRKRCTHVGTRLEDGMCQTSRSHVRRPHDKTSVAHRLASSWIVLPLHGEPEMRFQTTRSVRFHTHAHDPPCRRFDH